MKQTTGRSSRVSSRSRVAPYPPVQCDHTSPDEVDASIDHSTPMPHPDGPRKGKGKEKQSEPEPSSESQTAPSPDRLYVPRPQNKFLLFFHEMCSRNIPELAKVTDSGKGFSMGAKSKIVAKLWKGLSPEEKDYWAKRAEEVKEELAKKYPDHQYRPIRRRKKSRSRPTRRRKNVDETVDDAALSTLNVSNGTAGDSSNSATSEVIKPDEDSQKTPKPILNNAPLFHPKPSKLVKLPSLPENWYYTAKGKHASAQQQSTCAGTSSLEPSGPSSHGQIAPAVPAIFIQLNHITSPAEYIGNFNNIPYSHMQSTLGPESLLLQGFDYARFSGQVNASNTAINANVNLPSTSFEASGNTVNTYYHQDQLDVTPQMLATWNNLTSNQLTWIPPSDPAWAQIFQ